MEVHGGEPRRLCAPCLNLRLCRRVCFTRGDVKLYRYPKAVCRKDARVDRRKFVGMLGTLGWRSSPGTAHVEDGDTVSSIDIVTGFPYSANF